MLMLKLSVLLICCTLARYQRIHFYTHGAFGLRCEFLLVYYIKIGSSDTNASAKSVCSDLQPKGTVPWAGMLSWRNRELIAESPAVSQLCRRGRAVKSKSWSLGQTWRL